MALASLSMAVQNGVQNADALEHYQQVIPALKITVQSSQDSYSDGALLTHFILLLYEVCLIVFPGLLFLWLCLTLETCLYMKLRLASPIFVRRAYLTCHRLQPPVTESKTCGNTTGTYIVSHRLAKVLKLTAE
jgi:hypothetical protein